MVRLAAREVWTRQLEVGRGIHCLGVLTLVLGRKLDAFDPPRLGRATCSRQAPMEHPFADHLMVQRGKKQIHFPEVLMGGSTMFQDRILLRQRAKPMTLSLQPLTVAADVAGRLMIRRRGRGIASLEVLMGVSIRFHQSDHLHRKENETEIAFLEVLMGASIRFHQKDNLHRKEKEALFRRAVTGIEDDDPSKKGTAHRMNNVVVDHQETG
mmetsp:Transcript_17581/g.31722  ORF Transcript_17581/g.31722 Transcript_17581/m.31722 type:complete len:211 (-) Transcript_17581:431-1063(-)